MIPFLALLSQIDPDPYVTLAASLPPEEWSTFQTYVGQATPSSTGVSSLQAERNAVSRWAPILTGLRRISDMAYEPRKDRRDEDYAGFKRLERFIAYAAHVRFADGDRRAAVTLLLDGLTMARRIRQGTTLDTLVGTACEAIVMASFDEHLQQIPLADCERVRKRADAYLVERLLPPSDASPALLKALADSPRSWVGTDAEGVVPTFAKTLTQMRLLRLHMRIEAYRWRNLKLPVGLKDAAPESEFVDPLVDESYRYERTETGYRLTSAGFLSMGPMGLRYRRDPGLASPDDGDKGGKP